ncbi:hypothetical protein HG530_012018 [Fusarium avenaceum]|nr:hypothetical protein HG530_012018 [Fusarium avenaceum]
MILSRKRLQAGQVATLARVNIDLVNRQPTLTLPEVANSPEDKDNRESQEWHKTCLSDEYETDQTETEPRTGGTEGSLEGDLVQSVTLSGPGLAEANSQEPVKNLSTLGVKVNKSDESHEDVDKDRDKRASSTVNVGKDLGSIAVLGHGSQGSGAAVNARDTKRENRHKNDDVHEVSKTHHARVLANQNERRSLSVGISGDVEAVIGGLDQETDEEETENEEEGDTPENLLNGTGKSLGGVLRLGSSETNELSTGKRESGSDEDRAEPLEAVLESTRILVPELGTPVLVVAAVGRTATTDEDKRDDHEGDSSSELQAG